MPGIPGFDGIEVGEPPLPVLFLSELPLQSFSVHGQRIA
jgi:hypothetical protein